MQFIFHRNHSACSIVDNMTILTRFGTKMGMRFSSDLRCDDAARINQIINSSAGDENGARVEL